MTVLRNASGVHFTGGFRLGGIAGNAQTGVAIVEHPEPKPDRRGTVETVYDYESLRDVLPGKMHVPSVDRELIVWSQRNVLRGMHYPAIDNGKPLPVTKLVTCLQGEVLDVVVDMRVQPGNPKPWVHTVTLAGHLRRSVIVPPHCAHGVFVLSESALLRYAFSGDREGVSDKEGVFRYDSFGFVWPSARPVISERDDFAPTFEQAQKAYAVAWTDYTT